MGYCSQCLLVSVYSPRFIFSPSVCCPESHEFLRQNDNQQKIPSSLPSRLDTEVLTVAVSLITAAAMELWSAYKSGEGKPSAGTCSGTFQNINYRMKHMVSYGAFIPYETCLRSFPWFLSPVLTCINLVSAKSLQLFLTFFVTLWAVARQTSLSIGFSR